MFTCLISLLLFVFSSAIPYADRSDVAYPSLETLRSGMKIMKFRAFGEDFELKLQPAGDVISDDFAVMDSYGRTETTKKDVKSLKSKLFKDQEKGAVLYIDDDGIMEVNGIINSKLRIEPYESDSLVRDGIKAHLITESLAERKPFKDLVFSMNIKKNDLESVREFDESECVLIKYACVTDSSFSRLFMNSKKDIQTFIAKMMIKVQEIYDTLNLKVKVVLIGVIVLKDDPPFLRESLIPGRTDIYNVAHVLQNTSKYYCHDTKNSLVVQASVAFVITRKKLGEPHSDGTIFDGILGVANLGGACDQCLKYGVIQVEKENLEDGADSLAHETAHLLGSPHDGEGPDRSLPGSPTGINCPGSDGYIMGDDVGPNKMKFSSCSRANIIFFLGLDRAQCLIVACTSK